MCQMYKREDGVNQEVAGVANTVLLFVFIHFCFVFI